MAKVPRAATQARKNGRHVAGDRHGRDLVARIPDLPPAHVVELTGDPYVPCQVAIDRAWRLLGSVAVARRAVLSGIANGDVKVRLTQSGQPYFPTAPEQARLVVNLDDSTVTWAGDGIGLGRPIRLSFFDEVINASVSEQGDAVAIDTRSLLQYCQDQITTYAPIARSAGGRPRKEYWRDLDFEALCWLDREGIPEAEAPLFAHLRSYAADKFDAYPDDRPLRELARAAIERWQRHRKDCPA